MNNDSIDLMTPSFLVVSLLLLQVATSKMFDVNYLPFDIKVLMLTYFLASIFGLVQNVTHYMWSATQLRYRIYDRSESEVIRLHC